MIFATLKELTTMTPFIREKRLVFASKNPLTTPQEAKDATATLALWFFRGSSVSLCDIQGDENELY
jgi:hypothetical protein